jgi:hypothetical protein
VLVVVDRMTVLDWAQEGAVSPTSAIRVRRVRVRMGLE